MSDNVTIDFGPDKSQILRGIAIIFMIALHNDTIGLFKICVPIFTFLVGYGYAFAKEMNFRHAAKRSWRLLSHYWLILLGICLPVGILAGDVEPTYELILPELFGLESQLNWYSWYVYFYIWAMVVMIPASIIIKRYGLFGAFGLCLICAAGCIIVNKIPDWGKNMWVQAIFDCLLCSPPLFSGLYLAERGLIRKLRVKKNVQTLIILVALICLTFFVRGLSYVTILDFIIVPLFCCSVVILFNIIQWDLLHQVLISLGKESMNMWFFHALFATTCTAVVFAPMIMWIQPKIILISVMVIVSYFAGRLLTTVYQKL